MAGKNFSRKLGFESIHSMRWTYLFFPYPPNSEEIMMDLGVRQTLKISKLVSDLTFRLLPVLLFRVYRHVNLYINTGECPA